MESKAIVRVRDLAIGEGIPKICVPIVGKTRKEILCEAQEVLKTPSDMVEWRADCYEKLDSFEKVRDVLGQLRIVLGQLPLLFTLRTAKEGGQKEIGGKDYVALLRRVVETGYVDLVDVELFQGDDIVKEVVCVAQKRNVKVIASNHDFEKTPAKDELIARLCKMQELKADILKLAVMPQNKEDVLTLLQATEEMASGYAKRPVVTMSMGKEGVISRLCGEVFSSAITFGSARRTSAPGQIPVSDLSEVLNLLHKNI